MGPLPASQDGVEQAKRVQTEGPGSAGDVLRSGSPGSSMELGFGLSFGCLKPWCSQFSRGKPGQSQVEEKDLFLVLVCYLLQHSNMLTRLNSPVKCEHM